MKSSIIKAVTQTQFETCVTAFIALDFKLRREKLLAFGLEIISKLDSYFLMTVQLLLNQILTKVEIKCKNLSELPRVWFLSRP